MVVVVVVVVIVVEFEVSPLNTSVLEGTVVFTVKVSSTLCLKKTPPTFFDITREGLLDFNNFWRKCSVENRQSENGLFSHLT